jgi:uncharacterized membrane protein YecN with MAPEG domain
MSDVFTPLYAAMLGGFLIVGQAILMIMVGAYRGRIKQSVGIGEDMTLERLVRRHGNFAENAAIFIAVLAVYELINGQTGLAFWLALAFGIGRLAHAIGFSSNTGSHLVDVKGGRKVFIAMRVIGAMSTFFTFIALGGALAYSMSGLA